MFTVALVKVTFQLFIFMIFHGLFFSIIITMPFTELLAYVSIIYSETIITALQGKYYFEDENTELQRSCLM